MKYESSVPLHIPEGGNFLTDVLDGLRRHPRSVPPKYFYDAHGSHLFDLICDTPEYYPTRTEIEILEQFGAQMTELIGKSCVLIELGSGSATKTPLLLQHLTENSEYLPIDICESHLMQSTQRLQAMFPALAMHPLCMDYMHLPMLGMGGHHEKRKVVFFPGSTIGNCTPNEAVQLLRRVSMLAGEDGALLIGVDSKKSPHILNAAYNDADGYTAAFNRNLLMRMQRELGAEFDPDDFSHYAYYNAELGRIEMHLVSQRAQAIHLNGEHFHFKLGESIHTENSYKYTVREFQKLARSAGWHPKMVWSDCAGLFNVHYLSRSATELRHLPQKARGE